MKICKSFIFCSIFSISGTQLHALDLKKIPEGQSIEIENIKPEEWRKLTYSKQNLSSPQYLISDDPEYIRVPEAAGMREMVEPGLVRVYVYNVNGVKEPEEIPTRISAIIKNAGEEKMTFQMKRRAFPKPSGNYFHIGKTGLHNFLSDQPEYPTLILESGEAMPIDQEMEDTIVNYNDLVHGWYEFEIDQPARITVLQTDPDSSGVEADARIADPLPTKSKSGAGRGKFLQNNFSIKSNYDTSRGPAQLVVADGVDDPWVTGTEATIDEEAVLKGNYGVLYEIDLDWSSGDGSDLALLTYNERFGSQWCGGMAMSIRVNHEDGTKQVIEIPSNELATKSAPEYVLIKTFKAPPEGETKTISLTYSPPGASCLPTPILLLPLD